MKDFRNAKHVNTTPKRQLASKVLQATLPGQDGSKEHDKSLQGPHEKLPSSEEKPRFVFRNSQAIYKACRVASGILHQIWVIMICFQICFRRDRA